PPDPPEGEGLVGDADPLSAPPHAIVTAAITAIKKIPTRFIPAPSGAGPDPATPSSTRAMGMRGAFARCSSAQSPIESGRTGPIRAHRIDGSGYRCARDRRV